MSSLALKRAAAAVLVLFACTCGFDYEGAFTAASVASSGTGTGGQAGNGGAAPSGGNAGQTSSSDSVSSSAETAASSAETATSSSSCVEADPACGTDDHVCCSCTGACGQNLVCKDGYCRCSAVGEPCCGGTACDGDYLACIGGQCLNCCGRCKGEGVDLKNNFAAYGGDCNLAVKSRCANINGCPAPPDCCSYSCVITTGYWGICP